MIIRRKCKTCGKKYRIKINRESRRYAKRVKQQWYKDKKMCIICDNIFYNTDKIKGE